MKKTLLIPLTFLLLVAGRSMNAQPRVQDSSSGNALESKEVHGELPFEMPEIEMPVFKKDTFSIEDYGAIPNVGHSSTTAINAAILACSEAGGGVVVIPKGMWSTGPIYLQNNVNLHTENGAFVSFTSDLSEYKLVRSHFEGKEQIRCESPIMGIGLESIAITGEGIFDGNGGNWRPVKRDKMTSGQWDELVNSGGVLSPNNKIWYPSEGAYIGNEQEDKLPSPRTEENMEPYKQALRPVMVSLVNCKRLWLDGVTFQNSPAWNVNPLMCEHVTLTNLTIRNPWYSQNGDGLDLESCRIGRVANCRFDVGDDAICIKSGKDREGRERGMPTELFVIEDCVVYHAHGGFTVGSEMSGGVRNLFVRNLTFNGTDCGLRFKSTRGRGGTVENIWMEDIRMNNIPTEAIRFNLFYFGKSTVEDPITGELLVDEMPVTEETPAFRNMNFENIYVDGARQAVKIMGIPEMPVQNLRFSKMTIRAKEGIQLNYAKDLIFDQVNILLEQPSISVKMANSESLTFNEFQTSGQQKVFLIAGERTRDISLNLKDRPLENSDLQIEHTLDKQVKIME